MEQIIPSHRMTLVTLKALFQRNGMRCEPYAYDPRNHLLIHLPPSNPAPGEKAPLPPIVLAAMGLAGAGSCRERLECIGLERYSRLKMLVFFSGIALHPAASAEAKANFANELTSKTTLVRYSVDDPENLVARYGLPYQEGLYPAQIVDAAQLFARLVSLTMRRFASPDIIAFSGEHND